MIVLYVVDFVIFTPPLTIYVSKSGGEESSKSITYTKFQFIEVKCDNILKYIDKKFDLSFCKVCFDGENITVMNNINADKRIRIFI